MKRRTWSIRTRILTLLFAPLVPLVGMWIFSAGVTMGPALALLDAQTNVEFAGDPAAAVVEQLQVERKLSVLFVSSKSDDGRELTAQRAKTDEKIADFRRLSADPELAGSGSSQTMQYVALAAAGLDSLVGGRAAIDRRQSDRPTTIGLFTGIIDKFFGIYGSIAGVDEYRLVQQAATVIALTESRELLNREDSYIGGVLAAGTLTAGDQARLVEQIGVQRYGYLRATRYLVADDLPKYRAIVEGPAYRSLRAMEDRIMGARPGAPLPIDAVQWRSDFGVVNQQLLDLETVASDRTLNESLPAAIAILVRFVGAAIFGLVLLILLIIVAIRNARTLIHRIFDLRNQALEMATTHLPRVVARLRAGEPVDVEAETSTIDHGPDELGQLGDAFAEVQRTAIASAVQEASLRTGINQVFLNIARRNQALLHRQLSLLDAMERKVTDPVELEELFRIDHLAARMRRHAEDLVILAGAHPGRGWRNPVAMADVLRAAVSEVEEYTKVSVVGVPEVSLAGRAVSDVVHLLAELLENATVFSPGDTKVKLSGQLVPNGFAVEIEDRGVGMPHDRIEEANARLRKPPEFDPANSSRLGLFVVAKLAERHGITVTLRTSPYGGVTAVALIPPEVVVKPDAITDGRPDDGELLAGDTRELALVATIARPSVIDSRVVEAPASENGQLKHRNGEVRGGGGHRTEARQIEAAPAPLTSDGLPLRQRQASLSPKLRQPTAAPVEDAAAAVSDTEQMRIRLSKLQAGTNQGRRDAAAGTAADNQEEPS
ncbi:signal transduction histidine kinase [Allocatelliglobosispora scoriae]|uniref:histidine kinase n=1 Tax=Allocatelliglobosispora scoriae TaxID=643052 RepID=A0A841BXW8_9ACTN|nr:nitrate- and nitrite sensing domain-containing protein [Allocatelliglobosispora scoriae]MBB5872505.1 signal transduction histidine kinase [Allocatelliglobosispora scoriae]